MLMTAAIAAIASLFAAPVSAATIGSFDNSRVLTSRVLTTGVDRDSLRATITGGGHTIAPNTGVLTSTYLNSIDVFYTSALLFDSLNTQLTAAEQTALVSWVGLGGILLSTGEVPGSFRTTYEAFLNPFGITIDGQGAAAGSSWVNDPTNPLLSGGVAGQQLNDTGTALLSQNAATILARDINAKSTGISTISGVGLVVAIGDSNFLDDSRITPSSRQFFLNVLATKTGGPVSPVPIPAIFPIFATMMGLFGIVGWRRRRRALAVA